MAEKKNKPVQAPQNGQPSGPRRWLSVLFYVAAFVLLGYWIYGDKDERNVSKELSYTKLTAYIEADAVEKLVVYDDQTLKANVKPAKYMLVFGAQADGERAKGQLRAQVPSVEEFSKYMDGVNTTRKANGQAAIDVKYEKSHDYWYLILMNVLPFAVVILFLVYMSRGIGGAVGGGIFGVGKAKAQIFDRDKKDKVTFKDVAGLYGAKPKKLHFIKLYVLLF